MKPIYKPSGRAGEYAEWAINIYTGCPHRCFYCYAPQILHRSKEEFHTHVEPRKNIVEETRKQLETENITGRLINLCFLCDPYPRGFDTTATREIIKLIKDSGNHVQLLTKNDETRDLDLLDKNDWAGITYTGGDSFNEPGAAIPGMRFRLPFEAHKRGIHTWVSLEPVLDADDVIELLHDHAMLNAEGNGYIDRWKIGKLNYHPSDIDWKAFGIEAESICQINHMGYYIKADLRKEMDR